MLARNRPHRPMPTTIKAIFYDIDDCVALGSNADVGEEWDPSLAALFNLTPEEARAKRLAYFAHGCSLQGFLKDYGASHALTADWPETFYADTGHASARRFIQRHPPSQALAALFAYVNKRKVRQVIVTLGHPHHYEPISKHLGLLKHVRKQDRIDRTHAVHDKAEAAVWEAQLKRLKLQPHEALVFEDSPLNLLWPHRLGMGTVAIGNRTHPDVEKENAIHWRYNSVSEGLTNLLSYL